MKDPLPMDVEFLVGDIFEKLRPKMVRCKTLDEANAKIEALDKGFD